MKKKIKILNDYLLSTQNVIERIEDDMLDISQLDIDLALQHIRDLYDALITIERELKHEAEQEIFVEDDDFDVDEFVLSLDEEMADTFDEIDLGIPEEIEETPTESDKETAVAAPPMENVSKLVVEETENSLIDEEKVEAQTFDSIAASSLEENPKDKPKSVEHVSSTLKKEEIVKIEAEEDAVGEAKDSVMAAEMIKSKETLKMDEKPQTLFDFIEEKPSIQDKFNHLRIDDIRKAIGINEKFRFINELFKGDMNDYNDLIDKLNSFNSLTEAEKYLIPYKIRYEWDEEKDAYKEFIAIIERRYL